MCDLQVSEKGWPEKSMCMHRRVCVCIFQEESRKGLRGQKGVSDPWEVELQMVVSGQADARKWTQFFSKSCPGLWTADPSLQPHTDFLTLQNTHISRQTDRHWGRTAYRLPITPITTFMTSAKGKPTLPTRQKSAHSAEVTCSGKAVSSILIRRLMSTSLPF